MMSEDQTSDNPSEKGAYLIINSQIFSLDKENISVGRKLDNDLVIQEPLVSRNHAEIEKKNNNYHIHDLNSSSGTFVNNKKISSTILYSGDIILLANIPIMFVNESAGLTDSAEQKTGKLIDT